MMVSKLLETIIATFLLTAAAYAAGVVQSKELYRELGVEPELVSIDFQKALYDGGLLIFSELAKDFSAIIPYLIGTFIAFAVSCFICAVRSWVVSNGDVIVKLLSAFGYLMLLWVIYDVTVTSFGRGRDIGERLGVHLKKECTKTSVKYEGGVAAELCAIGRTADLLWFYDPKTESAIAFSKDKVVKVVSGG